MEDVLEVYHRPHDRDRPVVCVDETSKQLIAETRVPIPAKPGKPERYDYEYERNGTANLFMMFAPLEGRRHVKVTDRHTAVDYAQVLKDLSDTHYPNASKIVLVQDNLNTHKPASLYEAFPAEEARRLVERFEWHYTPKHGSWLDMAEAELSVLSTQCLDRRIADKKTLTEEVAAWEERWPGKFGHADKWKICLRAARMPRIRSDHGKTTTSDTQSGFQGEGGTGCHQGRKDSGRTGAAVRRSPEPDHGVAGSGA
jgi:DDE superfamily endonuclease